MTERLGALNPLQIDLGKHVLVRVYPPCYQMAMSVQRPLRLNLSPFVEYELPLPQEVLWDGIGAWIQGKGICKFFWGLGKFIIASE